MLKLKNVAIVKKTKEFKKIAISFIYAYPKEDKWTVFSSILIRVLLQKSKNFPNEEDFSNALIKNYIMSLKISKSVMGYNSLFKINIILPDNNVLKDKQYDYQESFNFLIDTIYNSCINEESFIEEDVEKAKNDLKNFIDKQLNTVDTYASIRLNGLYDDEGYCSDDIFRHIEEIDKINGKNLYDFYKSVILTKKPLIFILGNVDDSFGSLLTNSFPKNLTTNSVNTNYFKSYLINDTVRKIEESKNYNQSIVKFAYKIKDYTKEDIPKLSLIHFMLSSQSSHILQEYLRVRENLVYTSHSNAYFENGVLIITAQIYRDKKDIAIDTIYELMDELQKEDFIQDRLENIKERKRINLELQKNSMSSLLTELIETKLDYFVSLEDEYQIIKKISAEELVDFVRRLHLDTIYYLEGTNDGK